MRSRALPLCAALALAGCSVDEPGVARPAAPGPTTSAAATTAPTTTAPTTTEPPRRAPAVPEPLDATRFAGDPCSVLTGRQLAGFEVSAAGEPETGGALGESAPACVWHSDHAPIPQTYSVSFLRGNAQGLEDIYRDAEDRWKGYFEPVAVNGHPAVLHDSVDRREDGACGLAVGLSDTLALGVSVRGGTRLGPRSCPRAQRIAAAVLTTVKEA